MGKKLTRVDITHTCGCICRLQTRKTGRQLEKQIEFESGRNCRIHRQTSRVPEQPRDDYTPPPPWSGNRQVARWIEHRLEVLDVNYERRDANGGSIYFDIYDAEAEYVGKLRVADHEAPRQGGFSMERQERMGEADIDVNPSSPDWRAAVATALSLI